jgi:hypothetical protein
MDSSNYQKIDLKTNLAYYAYGDRNGVGKNYERNNSVHPRKILYNNNMAVKVKQYFLFKDSSSNIVERNYLSFDKNENVNSPHVYPPGNGGDSFIRKCEYLNPIKQFETCEKTKISPLLCNSGTYALHKKKLYSFNNFEKIGENSFPQLPQKSVFESPLLKHSPQKTKINLTPDYIKSTLILPNEITLDRNSKSLRRVKPPLKAFEGNDSQFKLK